MERRRKGIVFIASVRREKAEVENAVTCKQNITC